MKYFILLIIIGLVFTTYNQQIKDKKFFKNQSVVFKYKDSVIVFGIVVSINGGKHIDTAPFICSSYPNAILIEKKFYMNICTKI